MSMKSIPKKYISVLENKFSLSYPLLPALSLNHSLSL